MKTLQPFARQDGGRPAATHALIIRKDPLDKILAGRKTWEIRGSATKRRGPIGLIQSKSGQVVGTCVLVDVIGPLTLSKLRRHAVHAGFKAGKLGYATTYAWVMENAEPLDRPIPYRHPPGAVIWVKLRPDVVAKLGQCR